jgi:hypothetical protein
VFQKSIEAIIAQGVRGLEALKKEAAATAVEAQAQVTRSQSEIQSLVNLAKQVPEKVFDRYCNVLVSTMELYNADPHFSGYVAINNCQGQLRGLMGDEKLKQGKYRVTVLLEPLS